MVGPVPSETQKVEQAPNLIGLRTAETVFALHACAAVRARCAESDADHGLPQDGWSGEGLCEGLARMSPRASRSLPGDRARRPAGERVHRAAVERYTRGERVAQIEGLERRGLSAREIAEQLGLARSTVGIYRADPDGERQQQPRQHYPGTCANCGRPTSGSGGPKRAPERVARARPSGAGAGASSGCWRRPAMGRVDRIAPRSGRLVARPCRAGTRGLGPLPLDVWALAQREHGRGALRVAARGDRGGGPAPAREQDEGRQSRWNLSAIAEAMRIHASRTGQGPRRSDRRHASEDHPAASTVYRVAALAADPRGRRTLTLRRGLSAGRRHLGWAR